MVLILLGNLMRVTPASAEDPVAADRSQVVAAWRTGGAKVRAAAEVALLGSDTLVGEFLATGWSAAQHLDRRDALVRMIAESGPSMRAAAQRALDADAAGDQNAIAEFVNIGWQTPSDIDTRLAVNQLMSASGQQVREAGQAVLDAEDPQAMRQFLDSGWHAQWNTDQRLRVNQAMASGGPQVKDAGQRALDAGTPEALEGFLVYGWAVASARDEETASLSDLLAQAQAAGEVAAQETKNATTQADQARDAANAARLAAQEAAAATEAARDNMAEAEAQANRAANAATLAVQASQTAVKAAAAAARAARSASTAAARAATAAAKAGNAAAEAYRSATHAVTSSSQADAARQKAEQAMAAAARARDLAAVADQARTAIMANVEAARTAFQTAVYTLQAATANEDAVRSVQQAGGDAKAAIAAAARARAEAERAVRATRAAEAYLNVALDATAKSRDAALRAAANAEAAAAAAMDAAEHAGQAGDAALKATAHADAATVAAQDAVDAALQAGAIFEAARTADAERLAVERDQGLEEARIAATAYEAQQQEANWDIDAAAKRDALANQLIAEVLNPATEPTEAVASARQVALILATGQGAWTQQGALAALAGSDAQVLAFVRTGIAVAAAADNRMAVMELTMTGNTALTTAANNALAGSDAAVATFLRTQNYPGRYTADRMKVNQILSAAINAGDVVLAQMAQQALDAEDLRALRDFLDTGQYTAAMIGERVMVNQIMANPATGPEVKAAAQIALDGPAPALRHFLSTGQYTAAERDNEATIHLATVGGILARINEAAQTSMQNAQLAQELAARARNDADQANAYAQQAQESAVRASGYVAQAVGFANQAAASVGKAAAAVQTARNAATAANTSARSAIRSATWAITSFTLAVDAAKNAHAEATRALKAAEAAGLDAEAAQAAADLAFASYKAERNVQIVQCQHDASNKAHAAWEEYFGDPDSPWYQNCVANFIADPKELANRAYRNAGMCFYPAGSQAFQDCLHSVLDPGFVSGQVLNVVNQMLKLATGVVAFSAVALGLGCLVFAPCGAAASALITLGQVGFEAYKLINGDQSMSQTLLNLGTIALEAIVFAGIAKLVSSGFRAAKAAYAAYKAGEQVRAQLTVLNLSRLHMELLNRLRTCVGGHSFDPNTPVVMGDGSNRRISEVRVGDQVLATDPATGRTTIEPVTQLWRNLDRQLTRVEVRGDDGGTGTIRTTPSHPLWDSTTASWVDAAKLSPGHRLFTAPDRTATVTAVRTDRTTAVMHDLTVANTHTYYVLVDGIPILVHNTTPCFKLALGTRGIDEGNTHEFARVKGLPHYLDLSADEWEGPVMLAVQGPLGGIATVELHVNLRGFKGDNPIEQFRLAVIAGSVKATAKATQREMAWIAMAVIDGRREWSSVKFYDKNWNLLTPEQMPEPDWRSMGLPLYWFDD